MTKKVEQCENCGRLIGKLEQAYVYEGRVVCEQCNEKLTKGPKKPTETKRGRNKRDLVVSLICILVGLVMICACVYFIARAEHFRFPVADFLNLPSRELDHKFEENFPFWAWLRDDIGSNTAIFVAKVVIAAFSALVAFSVYKFIKSLF